MDQTVTLGQQAQRQSKPFSNPVEAMFARMSALERRKWLRDHDKHLKSLPVSMTPKILPADMADQVCGNWVSRHFGCVAWPSANPLVLCRLSIHRMALDPTTGSFKSGISWDDLFRIKNECGFHEYDAVEVFPAESRLVNVSNMRHLWVMAKPLPFTLQK